MYGRYLLSTLLLFLPALVSAHEPGAQVVGSATWKTIFFASGVLFGAILLAWIVDLLPIGRLGKYIGYGLVIVGILLAIGYVVYHTWIE